MCVHGADFVTAMHEGGAMQDGAYRAFGYICIGFHLV